MKLLKVKKILENKKLKNVRRLKKEINEKNKKNLNEIKVIAITGSCGKTTTAVVLHENLKALGYKSVLYSSAMVDSPNSLINKDEAYEIAVRNEVALLSIINEAQSYGADYLILEINESTIDKGFLTNVDFDVRVLTNLNPKHNLERYSEEKYASLKKAFFENINEDCKCVIGLQDYDKNLLNELLNLNKCEKLIFTSNYIANIKGVNPKEVTCLLTELNSSLNGLYMGVINEGQKYNFKTNVIGRHNALNFVCVMTILKALNIFDEEVFKKCVSDISIPGRSEVYNFKGKYIVIEPRIAKMLETIKEFKNEGLIKNIKVVIGSVGYGYKDWDKRYQTDKYIKSRSFARKYAMNILKDEVDYVYITESDNAKENTMDICMELQSYLEKVVPSVIIEDRKQAIKQAILDSEEGDVVFISGRGNRRVLCNSEETMKLVKDSDVVKEVIKELKKKEENNGYK